MALDKDILGQARYDAMADYNNKTRQQLITAFGSIEAARLAMLKKDSEVIIDHIKNYAEGKYQAGTLKAGANVVTDVVGQNTSIKLT